MPEPCVSRFGAGSWSQSKRQQHPQHSRQLLKRRRKWNSTSGKLLENIFSMKVTKQTFWELSFRFPPCLCRLLAKHVHGPVLTDAEIADRAQMTVNEVVALSQLTSWDSCDLSTIRRFTLACGVDFCSRSKMKRVDSYIRSNPTWKYLKKSGRWTIQFRPLLETYNRSLLAKQSRSK